MPCIWGKHNKSQIYLKVAILPIDMADKLLSPDDEYSSDDLELFNALVDTGANTTCISPRVAEIVGLIPIGKTPVSGVAGIIDHNSYIFKIGFRLGGDWSETNHKGVVIFNNEIHGPEINFDANVDVLLGMDIISTGSLALEGDGTFSFSF